MRKLSISSDFKKQKMAKQINHYKNKVQGTLANNEVDLCADISEQPHLNFAHWFHYEMTGLTAFKLKLTPEVLEAIEDCKKQQDAILKLHAVDYEKLGETYITCFDL